MAVAEVIGYLLMVIREKGWRSEVTPVEHPGREPGSTG